MRELTLADALLEPILARDPAGPRITFYDDFEGARIELSAVTLANWAAKTANLLRDEFAVEPGTRVAVLLPAHWQTAAVLLGCWWAGADVVLDPDRDADVALVTADRIDDVSDVGEVAALSLDAFGMPVRDLPIGITDYATSVRAHGDAFIPAGAGPALAGAAVADVLKAARDSAQRLNLSASDRVLSTHEWTDPASLTDSLLAVLAAGASLVQVANEDPATAAHRAETEKVTRRL